MNAAQLINQTSNGVDFGTDEKILNAARRVIGDIELDPASAAWANQRVRAKRFFTVADDGLSRPWIARTVWLNHPFGSEEKPCTYPCKKKVCEKRGHHCAERKPGNVDWMRKLVSEYKAGHFDQACAICFASTSEG